VQFSANRSIHIAPQAGQFDLGLPVNAQISTQFPQISPISTVISTEIAGKAISAIASRFAMIDIADTQVCDVGMRITSGPDRAGD
jgi:hypothetical protein